MASSFYKFTIPLFVQRNLPPDKRFDPMVSWVIALLSPIQWLQKFYLDYFINGVEPAAYNGATAYKFKDFVFYNNKVWFFWNSKKNNTSGVAPSVGSDRWFEVMDGKYGVYVRTKFNGSRIILEMILNNYFGTTTIPFPVTHPTPPAIYIRTNDAEGKYFRVFDSPAGTSIYDGPFGKGIYDGVTTIVEKSFSIMVPSAVYAAQFAIFGDTDNTDNKFKSVIKDYVYAGYTFDVEQY